VKVFLDTNVLVSAFTTRGLCADVVRLVLAKHELLSGEVILEELQQVLVERFHIPRPVNQGVIELLRSQAVVIPKPESPAAIGVRDPDDERVIASAMRGKADVLVTGDKDMLVLERIGSMPIYDPRGFWEYLKKM